MGTFTVGCKVANHLDRTQTVTIPQLLVGSGREYTWIPGSTLEKIGVQREKKDLTMQIANGSLITRSIGFAILYVNSTLATDEVVFAEKGDLILLGARSLEGLNLTIDSQKKKLVAAGPIPAA